MKKILALLISLFLFSFPAPAFTDEIPVLMNPQEQYELYLEGFDESQYMIWEMLDLFNDEQTAVDEHGSLTAVSMLLDENGQYAETVYTALIGTEYGPVIAIWADSIPGYCSYTTGDLSISAFDIDGEHILEANELDFQTQFDFLWENQFFPVISLEMTHGVRQDENYTYFIISGYDGSLNEYVTANNFELVELRQYWPDAEGNYLLGARICWEFGGVTVPDDVLQILSEHMPEESPAGDTSAERPPSTISPDFLEGKIAPQS